MAAAILCAAGILFFSRMGISAGVPGSADRTRAGDRIVVVNEGLTTVNIGPKMEFLEDASGKFSIGDVTEKYGSLFKKSEAENPNFGLTSSAYWFRFVVANRAGRELPFYLMLGYPLLDDIRLFIPRGGGRFLVKKAGDNYPFHDREFDNNNFVFPLKQMPGEMTYYLRVRTTSALNFSFGVYSLNQLYRSTMPEFGLNGFYYGVLFVMLIYNLFIFFSVRGKDYILYVAYLASFILTSLSFDGYGFHYLWPASTTLNISSFYIFFQMILFMLFTREFLGTGKNAPFLDRLIQINCVLGVIGIVLNIFAGKSFTFKVLSMGFTIMTISLVIFTVFVTLFRGVRSSKIFLASWSFVIAGAIIYIMRAVGILPMNLFTVSVLKYSMILQTLMFSIGLSDKINSMKKNLEREMDDHIRDREALQRSEERFRGVVERNFDIIFLMDRSGVFTYMSPSFVPLTGYNVDDIIGLTFGNFLPAENREIGILVFGDLLKGKEIVGFETNVRKKDGSPMHIEINLSPVMQDGAVTGVQGIARDITERKAAEDELLAEKERLAVTLSSIAEGVIATDINWNIHLMNRAAEELTGWSIDDAFGKPVQSMLVLMDQATGERRDVDNPAEWIGQGDGPRRNTLLIRRDKGERIISERAAPIRDRKNSIIGYVFVVRDITEEVKFHSELLKIEKLESIGVLAGGIAHDFNNILTAIIGNINLAKLMAGVDRRMHEILDDAEKASYRAQELTRQFLTFSKGGTPVRQVASLDEIIRDSTRFILRGSNVRCAFHLPETLWPAQVDVGQFSQVIQNLVINADQAMPDGGDLVISAENAMVSPEDTLPLKPGRYVKITVRDTGVGIPPDVITKIFDPYFTTKKNGNGLGLTSAFSIIMRHEGHMSAESHIGSGTSFCLYLPATGEISERQKGVPRNFTRGKGRVLFMDDDESVQMTSRKMLEYLGFSVDIAPDGDRAIELYREAMGTGRLYDLVILDLTVPGGMGGKKTIEKLRELDADVKAIVSSGYSNDMVIARYSYFGFRGFIAKPYRIDELSRVITTVIGDA